MKRKYITFIGWTFIVLAAVLVVGLLVDRKKALVSGEISTSPTKICFVKAAPAATGTDKYTLDITITGATATGSLALLPSEKDKKTGDFTGTMDKANVNGMIDTNIMGNLGTFWWKTTAEGMTNTEELRIKFADPMSGQARAFIGFGEMKDRGDGTYIYADPAAIDYSLELAEVNCGSDTGRVVDDMVLPPPPMDYTKPLDTKYITAASVWPAKVEDRKSVV